MFPKNGRYYLGWGWGSDENFDPDLGEFKTYEEALKEAKKSHKQEIAYQKDECGNTYDVMNTYVFWYRDDYPYLMATISGFRCKVEEFDYEWDD